MAARFAAMTVALLTGLLALATLASCNTEGDILFTQRQEWNDSNNVLQSWDPTLVNPCTWFHITCNSNNSVIRVDLGNAGLSGSLVPELGGLNSLQYLELFGNSITGAIPAALGNLSSLVSLGLQGNQLTGMIPASLGYLTNLKYLELQKNALSGPIPASLGNIKTLQILRLNGNMLSGTVPSEILSLVLVGNLTEINVAKNNLSGTVASSRPRVTVIIQDTLKTAS